MPPRIARPAGPQKEPSYQSSIPLDGADNSALDRFDQDDTAHDHPVQPPEQHTSTEVSLPADLMPADEPPPPPAPADAQGCS